MLVLELMVIHMNKKGVTIIELLVSISLISIVILLLIRIMFSLTQIGNDTSYASKDEITRTEIIKTIESDFLKLKLRSVNVDNNTIEFLYDDTSKKLTIDKDKLTYDETYNLKSAHASYNTNPIITYEELDNNYYLLNIKIEVLIENEENTIKDDIILNYIGLKKETNS